MALHGGPLGHELTREKSRGGGGAVGEMWWWLIGGVGRVCGAAGDAIGPSSLSLVLRL
jgi:hypothetical protein